MHNSENTPMYQKGSLVFLTGLDGLDGESSTAVVGIGQDPENGLLWLSVHQVGREIYMKALKVSLQKFADKFTELPSRGGRSSGCGDSCNTSGSRGSSGNSGCYGSSGSIGSNGSIDSKW